MNIIIKSDIDLCLNGHTITVTNAISVYDGAEVNDAVAEYVGDEKMSVNGVDGYNYTMGPFNGFTYAKNGKLVIITSNDDGILEDVVVK